MGVLNRVAVEPARSVDGVVDEQVLENSDLPDRKKQLEVKLKEDMKISGSSTRNFKTASF